MSQSNHSQLHSKFKTVQHKSIKSKQTKKEKEKKKRKANLLWLNLVNPSWSPASFPILEGN